MAKYKIIYESSKGTFTYLTDEYTQEDNFLVFTDLKGKKKRIPIFRIIEVDESGSQ